jgi:putative addiction module component (TIGR02574 family)
MTIKNIEKKVLELNVKSRAKLANKLLSSLEDLSETEIDNLWAEEALRRNEEISKGRVKLRPAEEVFNAARKRLK